MDSEVSRVGIYQRAVGLALEKPLLYGSKVLAWYTTRPSNKEHTSGRNSPLRNIAQVFRIPMMTLAELDWLENHGWQGIETMMANDVSDRGVDLAVTGTKMILQGNVVRGCYLYLVGSGYDIVDGHFARSERGGYVHFLMFPGRRFVFTQENGPEYDGNCDRDAEAQSIALTIDAARDRYAILNSYDAMLEMLPYTNWLASLARAKREACFGHDNENGKDQKEFYGTSFGRRLQIPQIALMVSRGAHWKQLAAMYYNYQQANFVTAHSRLAAYDQAKIDYNSPHYHRYQAYYCHLEKRMAEGGYDACAWLKGIGFEALTPEK